MLRLLVLVSAVIAVLNAQSMTDKRGASAPAPLNRTAAGKRNQLSAESSMLEKVNSEENPDSSMIRGPIGVDRTIQNHCTFFSNMSYTCKTDCITDSDTVKEFPENPQMKYTDFNCTTEVPIDPAVTWKPAQGIINKYFDPKTSPSQIVATCAFFRTSWFECFGVADCSRGEGITLCAGAAPWRGYYEGTPAKGFKGNITAEAMNSPPMHPSGPPTSGARNQPQVAPAPKRKIIISCDRFVDASGGSCYGFVQQRGSIADRAAQTTERSFLPKSTLNEKYYNKFDDVFRSIKPESIEQLTSDIVLSCHFFDTGDFLCGFPFAADFTASFGLSPATGTFYRGTM